MKMNAESLGMKMAHVQLQPAFVFGLLLPKDYHVFPFTAIRAAFVIMQMRIHAGNLIRAQI